ncbi:HAMP domain-containing sensor histidine kinase [Amorphoplanes nipponensis]|uniref:histidine kinase n=1 Tax=Actinoplanes nipponensis TaxID=135950 RepID=A0A919MKD3_9ACTN|nr:HAMP domain-containing sensor histidine kinase [Actinoplanes nipponensis]GIE52744.1 two-component sensor histidine kinase [Actinoplanes nipponensis]
MSSSRLTETRPAGWNPAGWPLRTRLVAIMIVLLVILGLAVGGTAEIYLHKVLYDRVDSQLVEAGERALGQGPGGRIPGGGFDRAGFLWATVAPPSAPEGSIVQAFTLSETGTITSAGGGLVAYQAPEAGSTEDYGRPRNGYTALPVSAITALSRVVPDDVHTDVDLGDELGAYRVAGRLTPDGTLVVTGLSLADTQNTLYAVAGVTGGVVLLALVAAGWAGAVIIRRTLQPLHRVAATATRVAELELDRGEVELAQRVPAADTDPRTEVGQVGAALNRLLDHVGNALEARHASELQVRQFVADASHELRTPLAAIRGYAELSRRSRQPVPDEIGHVLRRVESEATRMTALVEDLLLLARLDAGRPLAQDPVDLTMLVVDAVSDAHAAGPGHDWQLDLPAEPVTITGDAQRLHQVLANLLANARTHTPEGTTVTVGVSESGGAAVLSVTDAGPGIPADLQPHIFERFARGDSSRSRAAGSTGLGLSIVHAVVTAHGGTVAVRSEPGRTEFTVRLPMTAALPPAATLSVPAAARP